MNGATITIDGKPGKCISKEQSRYAISGACYYRGTEESPGWVAATDGRCLVAEQVSSEVIEGNCPPRSIIPPDVLPRNAKDHTLTVNGEWKNIGRSVVGEAIEGNMPPIGDVLPDSLGEGYCEGHGRVISLNAALLKSIADAIGRSNYTETGHLLTLIIGDSNKPVICIGRPGTLGVLMPAKGLEGVREKYEECADAFKATEAATAADLSI